MKPQLPANVVVITFDDGYADTLRQAQPRLAAAGVPATLFLATAFVGQGVEYWWDELARAMGGDIQITSACAAKIAAAR